MTDTKLRTVTIIYYCDNSLELMHHIGDFPQNANGRVIISEEFKSDKSILAVCQGEVIILNKVGDRMNMPNDDDNLL